jgi:hypothetical protein
MLATLGAGGGCDPTKNMPGATNCRRFGKAEFAGSIQAFQQAWNANYKTFAPRFFDALGALSGAYEEVLTVGLSDDGIYGLRTAVALQFSGYVPSARSDAPPVCACEMQGYLGTPAGQQLSKEIVYAVGNELEQPPVAPDPEPQQPQQPQQPAQQPPPAVVQFQQDQPVAGTLGRETNTTVYWGVGILALLAAGGTWYYLKGRKGRR